MAVSSVLVGRTIAAADIGSRRVHDACRAATSAPVKTPFGPNRSNGDGDDDSGSSAARYRTQKRGGKGLRDIKTTKRNGAVVAICRVDDGDEIIMMTSRGKLQRIRVDDISVIGRNTQGVRIMSLDDDDTLAAVVRVPAEEAEEGEVIESDNGSSPDSIPGDENETIEPTNEDAVADESDDDSGEE